MQPQTPQPTSLTVPMQKEFGLPRLILVTIVVQIFPEEMARQISMDNTSGSSSSNNRTFRNTFHRNSNNNSSSNMSPSREILITAMATTLANIRRNRAVTCKEACIPIIPTTRDILSSSNSSSHTLNKTTHLIKDSDVFFIYLFRILSISEKKNYKNLEMPIYSY